MKMITLGEVEVQLIGDQAYLYLESGSEVLNIPNIEHEENCEEILLNEIELLNNSSFATTVALFD